MNCIFNENCKFIKKYGNYCYKHRKHYLLKNNIIDLDKFTFNMKDYTIVDIKNTLKYIYINKKIKNDSKENLFNLIINYYESINNKYVIRIQKNIRRYIVKQNINYRGISYYIRNLCKNSEDFLYMTSPDEIENKYFFSYKDNLDVIWFFDIRSINKIIETTKLNPYTREVIPEEIINKCNKLINKLKLSNINTEIETINLTNRKEIIKQKTIDIFSDITQSGYYCDINWFLNLNIYKLKTLYKKLEDIWNYRAYLTNDTKSRICPPNGQIFNISYSEIILITNKMDLQEIILNDIIKFNNAILESDRKLGYMYFLIGLSEINHDCLNCHEWIQFIL